MVRGERPPQPPTPALADKGSHVSGTGAFLRHSSPPPAHQRVRIKVSRESHDGPHIPTYRTHTQRDVLMLICRERDAVLAMHLLICTVCCMRTKKAGTPQMNFGNEIRKVIPAQLPSNTLCVLKNCDFPVILLRSSRAHRSAAATDCANLWPTCLSERT